MFTLSADFFIAFFWIIIIITILLWLFKSYKDNNEKTINHYELGLKFMVENKNRIAIDHFKEAIRQDSNKVDAFVKLGQILKSEGAVNQALKVHKDLILRHNLSDDDRYNVYKSLTEDLVLLKKEDKAMPYLLQMIKYFPNDDYALAKLLDILENKAQYKEAFNLLKNSSSRTKIKHYVKRLAMYKTLDALTLIDKGLEKDARIIFKEALKLDNKCEAAYVLIGDSYWREDRKEEAIEKWLELCKEIPDKSHFVFERLEKAWFEIGAFYKIEEFYLQLITNNHVSEKALYALCEIRLKKGDTKNAIKVCKDYLEQNPVNKRLNLYYLALLARDKQNVIMMNEFTEFMRDDIEGFMNSFTCASCGTIAEEPHSKCPICFEWSSYQ